MAGEWVEMTVAELQVAGALLVEDGNHGENRPRPDEFSTEGIQFIRAADMDSGRVLFERAQRINEVARQRVRKGIGAGGDVLLSHKGKVGKVAYVPLDAPSFVCSPQTTFWRVKDLKQLSRRYIYFYLLSRPFREQLDSRKGETDMADYVSMTTQRTLTVTVPPLAEQIDSHRGGAWGAGRQDRVEPADERDAGGDGADAVPELVRGFRSCADQARRAAT
jgi:type I restriction enzyme S subunit